MNAERANFSTSKLHEATIVLPTKLTVLQEKIQQAQARMSQLSSEALDAACEIVGEGKTTGANFLDMALVLASYLAQNAESRFYAYHPDKIIETTKEIYSRLVDLDKKLKDNPGKPILLDRTKKYKDYGVEISLDLGKLSDSPSISHSVEKTRPTSTWFWHEIARSIRVTLEGYRRLEHSDNRWHPPMLYVWTNPNYQNQWFPEDITGFFGIETLPDYDYNGLKQKLFGEPTEYVGGIFIGKDEILTHLNQARSFLAANRNERTMAESMIALQPITEAAILL